MQKKKPTVIKQGVSGRQELFHTFSVDVETDYGDKFFGNFTCKKMSIADYAAVGVRKAQLNGGMHHDPENPGRGVDSDTDSFNAMLSQLEICIVSAPPWWDLSELTDMDVMSAVMKEVNSFESSFHRLKREKNEAEGSDGSGATDGGGDTSEAGNSGAAGPVVVEEVSTSLEP